MSIFFRFELSEKTFDWPDVYTRPVVVGINEEGKVEFEELCVYHEVGWLELLSHREARERGDNKKLNVTHIYGEIGGQ